MVSSARRRAAVQELQTSRGYSERRACQLIDCWRSTARYCLKRVDDSAIADRMRAIIENGNNRSGYRLLHFLLRRDEGIIVNHKRAYRIYRNAGLQVPKRKKRHARYLRNGSSSAATRPNERWSMDFVHDTLSTGRNVRLLTIVDDFTCESLAIEIDSTLPSRRVIAALERIIAERGLPEVLKTDNELRGFVNEFLGTTAFARIGFMNAAFGNRFLGCLDNKSSYHDKHKVPSRAFSELKTEFLSKREIRALSTGSTNRPNGPQRRDSPAYTCCCRKCR